MRLERHGRGGPPGGMRSRASTGPGGAGVGERAPAVPAVPSLASPPRRDPLLRGTATTHRHRAHKQQSNDAGPAPEVRHGERADATWDASAGAWALSPDAAAFPLDPPLTRRGAPSLRRLHLTGPPGAAHAAALGEALRDGGDWAFVLTSPSTACAGHARCTAFFHQVGVFFIFLLSFSCVAEVPALRH